jgi:hypothetical protein
MKAAEFIDSLCEVVTRLDSIPSPGRKLEEFAQWMLRAHGLDHVMLLDFQTGAAFNAGRTEAAFLERARLFSWASSLPARESLLPGKSGEGAVLAPLMNGSSEFVYLPLSGPNGRNLGALLLIGKNPSGYFAERLTEAKLVAAKIRDILLIGELSGLPGESAAALTRTDGPASPVLFDRRNGNELAALKSYINLMNFPMFILDLDGTLLAVNHSLLLKLKFESQTEFVRRCEIFHDIFLRGDILKQLNRDGGVRGKRCSLVDAADERVTFNLSAVRLDSAIVGSLFDVSEFVRVTDDLRESLKMQEFLNDKLISANLTLHKTKSATIRSLARLAEFRDVGTGDHLKRICEYSRLIAQEIFRRQPYADYKIRPEFADELFLASMLHDIGKVAIPDTILYKNGDLTVEEREVMKKHTLYGWEILNQADCELGEQSFLTLASHIALNHHERWDGSGYPNAIPGERIPHCARFASVADVYDALTSRRPYKIPWHHDDAIAEIKAKAGVHFDPVVVEMLVSVEKKVLDIHRQFPK